MGQSTSTISKVATQQVSNILNDSMNSVSSKSDSSSIQSVNITFNTSGNRMCAPLPKIDVSQKAKILTISSDTSAVAASATDSIMNSVMQLANQKAVTNNVGAILPSGQSTNEDITQISNTKNNIQNIVQNSINNVVGQQNMQKGNLVINDDADYPCPTFKSPLDLAKYQATLRATPELIGVSQVADMTAKTATGGILKALSDTSLKNVTAQTSKQSAKTTHTGLIPAAMDSFFGSITNIIIGTVILCGVICLAFFVVPKMFRKTAVPAGAKSIVDTAKNTVKDSVQSAKPSKLFQSDR